jgi:hypothetical protein
MRISVLLLIIAAILMLGSMIPVYILRVIGLFVLGLWAGNEIYFLIHQKGKKILFCRKDKKNNSSAWKN